MQPPTCLALVLLLRTHSRNVLQGWVALGVGKISLCLPGWVERGIKEEGDSRKSGMTKLLCVDGLLCARNCPRWFAVISDPHKITPTTSLLGGCGPHHLLQMRTLRLREVNWAGWEAAAGVRTSLSRSQNASVPCCFLRQRHPARWTAASHPLLLIKEMPFLLGPRHPQMAALLWALDGLCSAEVHMCIFRKGRDFSVYCLCTEMYQFLKTKASWSSQMSAMVDGQMPMADLLAGWYSLWWPEGQDWPLRVRSLFLIG